MTDVVCTKQLQLVYALYSIQYMDNIASGGVQGFLVRLRLHFSMMHRQLNVPFTQPPCHTQSSALIR